MNTDNHGEENSPFRRRRLPSLNALRCFEAAARLENFSRDPPQRLPRAARQPCPLAVRRAGRAGLPGERRRTAFPPRCRPARASRRRTAPAHGDPPASLEHLDPSRRTGASDDRRAALRALLPEPAGGRRRTRRSHRPLATGARRPRRRPAGGAAGIPRRRQQLSPADPATVAGRRACHAAAGMAAPQRGGLMRPAQGQARSARSTTASRRSQGTRSLACTLRPNSTVA